MTSSSPTMTFTARGKIAAIDANVARFAPAGTNYELHLSADKGAAPPLNVPVNVTIRVDARKVYTVPSGGSFIIPIVGQPRIIQGRVKAASDGQIIVQAGTTFIVRLPEDNHAIDLNNGPIAVGSMVNLVALPGARLE